LLITVLYSVHMCMNTDTQTNTFFADLLENLCVFLHILNVLLFIFLLCLKDNIQLGGIVCLHRYFRGMYHIELHPENRGSTFFSNVSKHLPDYIV
jgi:hypothetical protein